MYCCTVLRELKKFKNGLICTPYRCFLQAVQNQHVYSTFGKKLRLAVGGVAVLSPKPDWIWAPEGLADEPNDVHVWLEDEKGLVYDFIPPLVVTHAKCLKDEDGLIFIWQFDNFEMIAGRSKDELESRGLRYHYGKNINIFEAKQNAVLLFNGQPVMDLPKGPQQL